MQRILTLVSLAFLCLFLKIEVGFSQDLIERTQMKQTVSKSSNSPNVIARRLAAYKRTNAVSRSQVSPFKIAETIPSVTENFATEAIFLEMQSAIVENMLQNAPTLLSIDIPVNEKSSFTLDLYRVEVYSEDFRLRTEDNKVLEIAADRGIFYRGIIKGNPNSLASVTIFDDFIRIVVGDDDDNYIIGKSKGMANHVLYNDKNLLLPPPPACGVSDIFDLQKEGFRPNNTQATSRNSMPECVPIYHLGVPVAGWRDVEPQVGRLGVRVGPVDEADAR
ncbi:MAG: hypothetical protein AAGJ18_25170, partial [Bacteroidota bacterium]